MLAGGTAKTAAEALELVNGDDILERTVLYAAILALYDAGCFVFAACGTLLGIDDGYIFTLVELNGSTAICTGFICLAVKCIAEAEAKRRLTVGVGACVKDGDDKALSIAFTAKLLCLFLVYDHGVGLPRTLGSGAIYVSVEEHTAVEISEAEVAAAAAMLENEAIAGCDVDYLKCILKRDDLTCLLKHGIDSHVQIALVAHIYGALRILTAPLIGVTGCTGEIHVAYGVTGLFHELGIKVCGIQVPLCSIAVFNTVFTHGFYLLIIMFRYTALNSTVYRVRHYLPSFFMGFIASARNRTTIPAAPMIAATVKPFA